MEPTGKRFKNITYLGLFFVLVLTTIFWIPIVYKSILPTDFEARNYLMQASDWVFVGIILLIIVYGEKNSLSTLNIKRLNTESFSLGMSLGGFSMLYIVFHRLGFNFLGIKTAFEQQIENPELSTVGPEFIFVYGIFSLITAGVAEEIIYRGYATERLLMLGKSNFIAFLLPWLAFILMHYRKGMDHMLIVAVVGGLMSWYYIKYRNLTINIVGHLLIDSLGYIGILYKNFTQ